MPANIMPDNSGEGAAGSRSGGGGDVISIGGRDRKLLPFLVLRVCVKLSGVPGDEVSVSKQNAVLPLYVPPPPSAPTTAPGKATP